LKLSLDGGATALGMDSCVGKEFVDFHQPLRLVGKVENYLQDVIDTMKKSLNVIGVKSVSAFTTTAKGDWLKMDPAQITLLINMLSWVTNVEKGFANLKTNAGAMKKTFEDQVVDLTNLIKMVQGDLDRPLRQKIMCLITMDAHSRDIIEKLIRENVL